MRLFTAKFEESARLDIREGIGVELDGDRISVYLGLDVGGETLVMVPLRIDFAGFDADSLVEPDGTKRVLRAEVESTADGRFAFVPERKSTDDRALLVLSVMQRSPDARTEVADFEEGVEVVANAFERPLDRFVLVLDPGARVLIRRFSRGANFGPWHEIRWTGVDMNRAQLDGAV